MNRELKRYALLQLFSPGSLDRRQGRRCDTLPDRLEMIICGVERNLWKVWELLFQHLTCGLEHKISTITLAHAAQNHHVFNLVGLLILCKCIAQIHTTSLV